MPFQFSDALSKPSRKRSMRLIVGQRLVECLFTTGGEEEASEVVGELRRLKPDDPDVLYLASKAYANLWNATVQRLLEKSADSYRAHQILAEVLETQEKFGEAAAEYRAIIRLQPRMPAFHYKLGKMLLRADPTPQGEAAAMAEFRAELDINPFDVPSHVEIGELELKAGRVEEAYKLFSRAVALQPGHATAQLGLARALIASRQYEKALDPLEQARRLSPQNEAVLYQKMLALRSLGRQTEARQAQAEFQKLKVENEQKRYEHPRPAQRRIAAGESGTMMRAAVPFIALFFLRPPGTRFASRTTARSSGLTTPMVYGGAKEKKYILETTGSGVALIDYDGGRLDGHIPGEWKHARRTRIRP